MRLSSWILLIICIATVLFSSAIVPLVHSQAGNAEVARIRNQQYFQLQPNNADVTRYRNLQYFESAPNQADVTRYRNLQHFELTPNPADVTRFRNLQYFELAPNYADIIRYRNLMYFQLEPNNADAKRYRNLQYFLLEPLIYAFKINVTSLTITDQNGSPTSNFLRGGIVQFDFIIENLGGPENLPLYDGLISTVVLDSSNTLVFLSYTFEDLPRGASEEFIIGYRIPTDGLAGTYTVKVMVFTDWPSEGGLGLAIEESTFTVS